MRILKGILKWGGLSLLAIIIVILGLSQYRISSGPDRVPNTLQLPTDAQSLAEGERLARTRGCLGCHGENLAGQVFFDEPVFARVIVPNLTTTIKGQSVENIEAAIRQGIGYDGHPLVLMPSFSFSYLTDDDTAKIIAYLKTFPEVKNDLPTTYYGPIARLLFATGKFETEQSAISHKPALRIDWAAEPQLALGEYLAMTMCSECHGVDLNGQDDGGMITPNLDIVATYTPDKFMHLLKTGEGVSRADLGVMSEVARSNTVHLNEQEIHALYAFLTDRIQSTAATVE